MARLLALAFIAVCAFALPADAQTFPQLTSRVVDGANIIDIPTEAEIEQKLVALEQKTTSQLVVVTVPSLQGYEIEDYGYRLGRHWGIGQEKRNNGALLLVAPNERKVRIEVGYGLEGLLTDAISSLIIQNAIIPRFKANDYPGGISRGVDDIVQVLEGDTRYAEEAKAQAEASQDNALRSDDFSDAIFHIFIMAFIAYHIWLLMTSHRRRRRSSIPWIIPTGSSGSGWSSGSSGGGWSSGSSSGGGFSGGGGSFGGGGSSGSW